ncbi:aminomethyl-transferring glycine dehydrogenase subunit GcvPA [Thermocrinis minervae]|uniref:Probable glycine dehydrogenase (decarboxylating) subunit 1 n=1 Tax=Thermocrinis minervae TaxID=381751 RepID=A0A1M6TBY7_9AQUI|nr:aminomethyl-transferring glycine dehydrogenase subunit GcvPA [Thermocrinis minervae]SHK54490.1 glycine dehydrogenase (decarboxylating) alpha subunit [Thermocrinis minervae]
MYIPHGQEDTKKAFNLLGISSFEELYSHIDPTLLVKPDIRQDPLSEEEIRRFFKELEGKNRSLVCFAGFGAYDRIVPSVIWQILNRGEFLTSYTPYQPEASQGTLQAIFEYQTLICELTGMDVANASVYDGATALSEAILMVKSAKTNADSLLLSEGVNPLYRDVVRTYITARQDEIDLAPLSKEGTTDLERLEELLKSKKVYALAIQQPNFLGYVENVQEISKIAREYEVPLIVVADPVALAVLKPPNEAHVVVGEGQQLGIPLNFGGPYVGFFATKMEYLRRIPGRLVGMGEDVEGKRAFLLVLQTREQHIRRERATSNICTNQNLMAIANVIYLSLLGKEGLIEVAKQSLSKALYLKQKLLELGFEEPYTGKHLWEYPLRHPRIKELRQKALKAGFLFGVDLSPFGYRDTILLATTEKRTKQEIDRLVEVLKDG